MASINPAFSDELKKYGIHDFQACYNCGTCTAICSLSTENNSFPREMIRYSSLGLEDNLKSSLKPWLCYYCGECSTSCPRQANPGELMMSLRRWLTSAYDWTGLSGILYKSFPASSIAFIMIALAVTAFADYQNFNLGTLMPIGHSFEMIAIGTVFLVILLPNIIRMWWFIIGKPGIKVSLKTYFQALGELFVHMFTQKKFLNCDDSRFKWFEHFILVISYLALLFTTVFLDWLASENLFVIILGYLESFIIFLVTIDFVRNRVKKTTEATKHSQPSDWFFVIWLLLMGISSFLVRLFADFGILEQNVWLYLVHMIVLVQWALIIVPFGKWTHFLYRSFAMYMAKLQLKS
jgi:ferredoxin